MYWRLERGQLPDKTMLKTRRTEGIICGVRERIAARHEELSDELARDIGSSIVQRLGKDLPAHYKFLYGIEDAVEQQNKARGIQATDGPELGVTGRDVAAVIAAWDKWATTGDNQI